MITRITRRRLIQRRFLSKRHHGVKTHIKSYFRLEKSFYTTIRVLFRLDTGTETKLRSPYRKNFLTEDFGFVINSTFHVTLVIMLLNMLTAMMTKSYVKISVRLCFPFIIFLLKHLHICRKRKFF